MPSSAVNPPLAFSMIWPPGIVFGAGAVAGIGERVRAHGGSRVLLVTDAGLERAGVAERVAGHLREAGVQVTVFAEVQPNPTMTEVTRGMARFRDDGHDFLVALGGGSSIDAAKVMSMQMLSGRSIEEIAAQGVDDAPGTPVGFLVVPTTSGTGSEATTGALVKDDSGRKYLVRSVRCRPLQAILDPELTLTVPPRMTAATGMDAFIHALGSYTNAQLNPFADLCAREAIRLASAHLPRAVADGADLEARTAMMMASHLAGISISLKGNDLIHGLSTAVESMVNCTHGESLSAIMPHVLRFNHASAAERYADIANLMGVPTGGMDTHAAAAAGIDAMIALRDRVGTATSLGALGVREDMIPRLTELASRGRSTQINCRVPDTGEITALIEAAVRAA